MRKAYLPIIVAMSVVIGILIGNFYTGLNRNSIALTPDLLKSENKISEILNLIDAHYVETLSIDSLTEGILPTITAQLDPHSSYMSSEAAKAANEEFEGSFFGIGVQFNLQNDTIYIVKVLAGSPSEKVGIMNGDKIIAINDTILTGKKITNEYVLKTLKGKKNTQVKLGIVRYGNSKPTDFVVTRGEVPIKSVDVAYMITPKIGYVSVNKFAKPTYKEFLNELAKLRHNGAERFIIDLRGNAGGVLEAAINMLNEFLQKGDMIIYMEGAKQPREDFFANGIGSFKDVKIAVLIDEFSGSASEIFAGAMQDNDRGLVIGRRSFGKGLVQRSFVLKDKSELRVTIARYYTPSGRCIQKPYKRGDLKDYDMDLINRYNHSEFYNQDSIKQNETLEYQTKSGRKVYGGGGIMPDIFVKNDTLEYSKYFKDLVNKGLIYKFALQYTENHRNELKNKKTWQEIADNLQQKDMFNFLVNYGERNGVFGSSQDKAISHKLIKTQVIAYIIRNILSEDGFFPYYNQSDKCVQRAVEELSK